MPRIFVAQNLIDRWLSEGWIQLDGELLKLATGAETTSLFINPAVFFVSVDGGEEDQYQVLGCVKSAQELTEMAAEHLDTSVIMGEQAYTVTPGFVAVPVGPDGTETLMDSQAWGRLRDVLQQMES